MKVSVVVPFRPGAPGRERNWRYLRERYEALYPEWEIVVGSCRGAWSKGAAVNAAVRAATGDALVIADADVMLGMDALPEAVRRLDDSPWVVPHRVVYRLTEAATVALIEDRLAVPVLNRVPAHEREGDPRSHAPGGGVAVMRREDFVGVDERFIGWGGEDVSFARALDTLVGGHRRLGEVCWHLRHEPMPRREGERASEESEALAGRYLDAAGNRAAMRALLDERPSNACAGGGYVVLPRGLYDQTPLDPRFEEWGQEDAAFGRALATTAGPPGHVEADLVHLHHEPAERQSRARGSDANVTLWRRYADATGDPLAMHRLTKEAREHNPPD